MSTKPDFQAKSVVTGTNPDFQAKSVVTGTNPDFQAKSVVTGTNPVLVPVMIVFPKRRLIQKNACFLNLAGRTAGDMTNAAKSEIDPQRGIFC